MEVVEVQFKAQRKEFYRNTRALYLRTGNYCVVQADRGEDMGQIISITRAEPDEIEADLKEVLRHATEADVAHLNETRAKESEALKVCQQKVSEHKLPMKLVDVECQFDGNKITFYFTSEGRIDFRELVKDLAGVFRTRIDLRQIGVRDEARRFDGMGMCGRRLCCATFLKDFEPVTLKMAKDQNLPLTPSKISGACGRLMCCLDYELEYYKDLTKDIPKIGSKIQVFGGEHRIEKVDIFNSTVILSDAERNQLEVKLDVLQEELRKDPAAAKSDAKDDVKDAPKSVPRPGARTDSRSGGRGDHKPGSRNRTPGGGRPTERS